MLSKGPFFFCLIPRADRSSRALLISFGSVGLWMFMSLNLSLRKVPGLFGGTRQSGVTSCSFFAVIMPDCTGGCSGMVAVNTVRFCMTQDINVLLSVFITWVYSFFPYFFYIYIFIFIIIIRIIIINIIFYVFFLMFLFWNLWNCYNSGDFFFSQIYQFNSITGLNWAVVWCCKTFYLLSDRTTSFS